MHEKFRHLFNHSYTVRNVFQIVQLYLFYPSVFYQQIVSQYRRKVNRLYKILS